MFFMFIRLAYCIKSLKFIYRNYKMQYTGEQIGLIVISIMKIVTYLVFLGFYAVRINKLDKLASNRIEKDRSLKFRIVGIILLIALNAIHVILAYSDPNYYMALYPNYSLVDILGIFDLLLQIYVITREYRKKTRRSRSVVALWIFMALEQISVICIVQVYSPSIGIILPIFKVIVTTVLIVLTCLAETPQQATLQVFQQNVNDSKLLPILSSNQSSIYTKKTQNIYIQFNKQFQVSFQKDHFQFSFKIAVYVFNKFHIITKSQTQFIKLSKEMLQIFPTSEDSVTFKNNSTLVNASNITKCGEEKQKIYEVFLINLTKTSQFYAEPLMNFLQIHESQRSALQKHKGSILKKDTINSDEQQKHKKPFFLVSWKNQKIRVSNPQILDFFINKTQKQLVAFHQKLLMEKRLKVELISDQNDPSQLSHFIYRVANSKYLWRPFADWMCLGSAIQDKIYNMFDFWNMGFHNIQISVIGYETSFDKSNSVIYYYLISMNKKNANKEGVMLKKRFNDFVKLDRNIRQYLITENIKNVNVPSLPPKFSPFQSKTSPNSRSVYFDSYVKDIIKIEGINHCIKFLQFLEVQNEHMGESLFEQKEQAQEIQEKDNQQLFNSICLDELEV